MVRAASMDGCGYFLYVITIVIQLVKPALVTAAIFQAIGIWNDIIGSTVYLADKMLYPIVLGLYQFYGDYSNQWTVLSAGIIIVALPLILLYVSLQRFFVEGAVAGAI
jgi:raffinose/stachyose/melibiose transport system permease protein